ncbi:hypothetical protein BOSEA31B_20449 [Hyphomicrobiales bacterium]|nr:hypothetical protein BOSEA31B_20449 [Hyphomicrobiales bacterium]CAH1702175.1 hypothetical protein BOSEA1005_30047 [Hyphomicrobiales bacterium]CAI0346379.1 hypothetical protein BO1005MUT1_510020 [Hyphomicrobiales bacterium]
MSSVGVADCDAEKRNSAAALFDDAGRPYPDLAVPLTRERTTSIAVEAALASRALSRHFSQIEAISVDYCFGCVFACSRLARASMASSSASAVIGRTITMSDSAAVSNRSAASPRASGLTTRVVGLITGTSTACFSAIS